MQSNMSVHVDMTAHFSTCSVFLSNGNKCNQNLHSPGMGLHVGTMALSLVYIVIIHNNIRMQYVTH